MVKPCIPVKSESVVVVVVSVVDAALVVVAAVVDCTDDVALSSPPPPPHPTKHTEKHKVIVNLFIIAPLLQHCLHCNF